VSMRAVPWPDPDPVVAAAVRAKYAGRRVPLAVAVRDRLGQWMADEVFAAAFGVRGRPGWPPSRLAVVTVLQMAEDLTDRQAAGAVRTRLDWQYALGLGLADPGFDHSVLSESAAGWPVMGWKRPCWMRCWPGWLPRAWCGRAVSSGPIPRTCSRRSGRCIRPSWPGRACARRWKRWRPRARTGSRPGSA
jgi:hypothetical protein